MVQSKACKQLKLLVLNATSWLVLYLPKTEIGGIMLNHIMRLNFMQMNGFVIERADYTILEPGRLTFDEGTGKINTDGIEGGAIPREDVAAAVVASLTTPETIKKTIPMVSGQNGIKDALASI